MIDISNVGAMSALGIGLTLIIIVLAFAICALGVWLIVKNTANTSAVKFTKFALIAVLVAVVLRFVLSLFIGGYRDDILTYKNIVEGAGFSAYYAKFTDQIFPVPYYLIMLFGAISKGAGFSAIAGEFTIFVKIPFILADGITVALLYKIASKYINEKVGLVIAGIFAIAPVFVLASGVYGSAISLLIPLLIWSLYSLINKRHFQAILAFGLAMISHIMAVYLFPVFAIYYGYRFIRSIIVSVRAKKAGESGLKSKLCIKIPVFFLASFLITYIVCLPLTATSVGANPFVFIFEQFINPLTKVYYFSNNGLSIFNIFGRNAATLGSQFPTVVFLILFAFIISGIVSVIYFSKRNTASVCLILTYIL
ncbi:MAG: glycosyltransferase family 39 protein, partial [Clostridia bacterium]|nr:glycosyltransferase family 39 protein [Clostridia bacterium]